MLLRLPASGGTARAYRWGTDSVLWSSPVRVPALERTLAFDDAQGSLAYVDRRGVPGRLDLRIGSASAAATTPLTGITSVDGWAIYGMTPKHDVSRLTPSGTWTFTPAQTPRGLLPLPDGSLILLRDVGNRHELARLHPPEARVTETTSVPHADLLVRTDLGDRLYFIGDSGLAGVRTRDLTRTKTVWLPGRAVDAVATPSGDRIYVALKGKKSLTVVDRFAEEIEGTIDLSGAVTGLRMDPDGRHLLARAADTDSVLIVAIGTSREIGTVRSQWRADLPLLGPDGGMAVVQDTDVVIIDVDSHHERTRFLGGAADLWTLVRWNGFRPRAKGLDVPVNFDADSDSTAIDTTALDTARAAQPGAQALPHAATAPVPLPPLSPSVGSAARAPSTAPSSAPPGAPPASAAPAPATGSVPRSAPAPRAGGAAPVHGMFTLSFAAVRSEAGAKTLAASILVDGRPARVVPGIVGGTPIYRVVYGPFDTHDAAVSAGKRTGLPYWVYEGAP